MSSAKRLCVRSIRVNVDVWNKLKAKYGPKFHSVVRSKLEELLYE